MKTKSPKRKKKKSNSKLQLLSSAKLFTRPYRLLLFVLAFAVIGIGYVAWSHAAVEAATGPITGIAGKCLDNRGNLKVDGNEIQLWQCNGDAAQKWTSSATASTAGTIVNSNGYCLDVYHSGKVSGTLVDLWRCNGTAAQNWKVDRKS